MKEQKIESFKANFKPQTTLLLISFLGLFFLPYNIGLFKIIGPLALLFILPFAYRPRSSRDLLRNYTLPALTIIFALVTRQGSFIGSAAIVSIFAIAQKSPQPIKRKWLLVLGALVITSCSLQLYFLRGAGRPVLFIADPNFSGMYFLILLFFFVRVKNVLGQLYCIACAFPLMSRAYLYSIVIFYTTWAFQKITKLRLPLFVISFVVIGNIFFGLFSFSFFSEALRAQRYFDHDMSRLLPAFDSSVQHRFEIFNYYVVHILKKPIDLFMGIKNYEVVFRSHLEQGILHNSFLSIIARFGLLACIPYLLLLSKIFTNLGKEFKKEAWWQALFYSWIFFSLFIHGFFETYLIFGFLAVLYLKIESKAESL